MNTKPQKLCAHILCVNYAFLGGYCSGHQSERAEKAEAERDKLRRQLSEAQTAIDAMAQIVGAADRVRHQLEQAHSDIEDYRAEIARLHQAMTA